MASRRCARPGCRAWAVRGKAYCWAHRNDNPETSHSADGTDGRSLRAERFAAAVHAGRQDELIDQAVERILKTIGAETSLTDEIGALRLILKRVITMDALNGDP